MFRAASRIVGAENYFAIQENEMTRDEAIEEIREVRRAISAEFDHDTRALLDHYRELERRYADRLLGRELAAAGHGRQPSRTLASP